MSNTQNQIIEENYKEWLNEIDAPIFSVFCLAKYLPLAIRQVSKFQKIEKALEKRNFGCKTIKPFINA